VLEGVSLDVPGGAITALIGPNGSGKSTLFDVVTGFVPPDGGEILFGGTPITGAAPHKLTRLGLTRTFQVPRVARSMTVLENLMVVPPRAEGESIARLFSPLHVSRIRRDERARLRQAEAVLDRLGLLDKGDELAGRLSGGQTKLLAMGMAEMMDPETLLLDEPTAGVHPMLIERIVELLAERRQRDRTTLIIEHNISVVARICSSVYVLDVGRVIAHGTPREVQQNHEVISAYLGRQAEARSELL
jgi:ABC-type branched-subunit amino acid transport system ATPase component